MRTLRLTAALLLLAATASAQTLSLDRQDGRLFKGNLQVDVLLPTNTGNTGLHTELYTQGVWRDWGGYVALPLYGFVGAGQHRTELGNTEIGGLLRTEVGPLSLVGRFGVVLPTANGGVGPMEGRAGQPIARMTDRLRASALDLGLRPSLSVLLEGVNLWMRADFGVDFALGGGAEQVLLRANLGVGARIGPVSVVGEFVNIGNLNRDIGLLSERFLHAVSFSLRAELASVSPYLGYTIPLDEPYLGRAHLLSLGLSVQLDER